MPTSKTEKSTIAKEQDLKEQEDVPEILKEESERNDLTVVDNVLAFQTKLCEYNAKIIDFSKQIKDLQHCGKTLEKEFTLIAKTIAKTVKKNKSDKPRPLSGFAVPSLLSKEMYTFLMIKEGELVPRKDVTKMINEYIKKHNCRDENDKRTILPDAALKKLFRSKDDEKITYFNLQTYLKHHYMKQ